MIEPALSALAQLFQPLYFGLFLLGIFIGMVMGVIPGLSGLTGLALVLPFTVALDANAAIPLCIGLLAPVVTSDSIPAILIGTPGTAACAATVMDGYPMSKKGQAGKALGAAFTVSAMGGIFGAMCLFFAVPVLKELVLLFHTPEFLALGLLAVSLVAVLGGGNALKGIIAAGVGLLIAMIGEDPIKFVARWSFDNAYLVRTLDIIPVALGIFAIPEIVDLCLKSSRIAEVPKEAMQGKIEGLKEGFRHWKLVIASSAIGAFVGFLPALGGTVSTWIAYSFALLTSKKKGGFGEGDIRGVIAPEACNNASIGGALIPTIAFGVPGSTVMALLLSVFWIVGVTPGPKLLTEHIDLVYLMIWSVAIANLIGTLVCFLLTDKMAMITTVPINILAPLIIVVVFAGTLFSNLDIADLVALGIFSVLGWVMKRLGWSRPALLLALILGRMVEKYYFQTLMMYGSTAWLLRPTVMIILAFAVGILFLGVYIQRKAGEAEKG